MLPSVSQSKIGQMKGMNGPCRTSQRLVRRSAPSKRFRSRLLRAIKCLEETRARACPLGSLSFRCRNLFFLSAVLCQHCLLIFYPSFSTPLPVLLPPPDLSISSASRKIEVKEGKREEQKMYCAANCKHKNRALFSVLDCRRPHKCS